MANSKKKGNKGEREVVKWWTGWTGKEFARVPASGGLRWHSNENISGDVICTQRPHDRHFQFCIESKNYKDINFEHLLLGNKKVKILDFWEQTVDDATRSSKIPILFMRYNGMPKNMYFTIISMTLFKYMRGYGWSFKHTHFEVPRHDFVILNSNDLLSMDYIHLHKLLKTERKNGREF